AHPHGARTPDAEACPASAEAHSPGAHAAVALLRARLGGADTEPADGLVHPGARRPRSKDVGDRLTLERTEQPAPEGPGPGFLARLRIHGRAPLPRGLGLLLGRIGLADLARLLGRGLALLGPGILLLLPGLRLRRRRRRTADQRDPVLAVGQRLP